MEEKERKILINRARCKNCGDVITSRHRHDFVSCSCGNLSVDGGTAYIRRCYKSLEDVEELSQYEPQ